ncbi:MAG: flagellar FliJ family protein [Melioribacteraceae bacterium]|nr:flagellar FliJ family protein [Melioribacteraceae bacterium]
MKKFKYKFDSVLNFKETIKKQAMKEVAFVGKQIEEFLAKKENLISELKGCKLDNNKSSIKISELQFLESHIFYIKKKIEFVDNEIARLKLLLKLKQNELIEKTKESKVFQKLKESKLMLFKKEENKLEIKMLDELATQKVNKE